MPEAVFYQRSIGANHFPPSGYEIKVPEEMSVAIKNQDPFHFGGFYFQFDESVYASGWWATVPGVPGTCFVYIHI